jgi:3-oxoacyl-[acyl-carrier protein] reductase
MTVSGKVAIVTGGARGIGAATAERLLADGVRVAITDLDVAGAPDGVLAIPCDVTSRADVEGAVERTVAELGSLDILVTCAGITRDNLIHKMTDDDWDGVIATHLRGTFLAAQAAQRVMVPNRSGRMVMISSISALGNRGQTNYAAAKAGIQGMARSLAIELGPFGINVNCVAPGFVKTRMTQAIAERSGVPWEEIEAAEAAQIPLRRIGKPEDISSVISFLCGPDSEWVSGQVIYVRGGP